MKRGKGIFIKSRRKKPVEITHADILRQTDAFIAEGNSIEIVKEGVSGDKKCLPGEGCRYVEIKHSVSINDSTLYLEDVKIDGDKRWISSLKNNLEDS